jgi:site-specific DNA recombinase
VRFFSKGAHFTGGHAGHFNLHFDSNAKTATFTRAYLEYPAWEVALRDAKHPALIDMETFEKVQIRLGLRAKAPYRKDLRDDFPLRGFILCAECREPMTAAWSTGRNKKYPYYRCKNKSCHLWDEGIRGEVLETEFVDILKDMKPSKAVLELAEDVVRDCWKKKRGEHSRQLADLDREKKSADHAVARLTARLLETDDRSIIKIYENQLKELEMHRQLVAAQAAQSYQVDTTFEGALGTVFDFIGNPLSLWESGDLEDKRLVLKLAFAKKIPFDKETGFGTAVTSLPFTVFRGLSTGKERMVAYSLPSNKLLKNNQSLVSKQYKCSDISV